MSLASGAPRHGVGQMRRLWRSHAVTQLISKKITEVFYLLLCLWLAMQLGA